jgi:8-hydroxy-5-deazaflavin:NADPH oxidoreductase
MRIGVIGTGHIGGTLGTKWLAAGHEVVYGSRRASGEGPGGAPVRTVGDSLADAEVVALAIPGGAVADLVAEHGAALASTIVIDTANRMGAPEFNSRKAIAAAAPTALYVRAFNSLGWENFADPLPGAELFFAADPGARVVAQDLITAVGLRPEYVGDPDASGIVDSLLPLWMAVVRQHGGNRRLAFRIVE